MIGHVVPWCLGCGLEEHDPVLFDDYGDPIFDDDAFDIDLVAQRLGNSEMDVIAVAEALGIERGGVWAMVKQRTLEPPVRYDPVKRNRAKGVWTSKQVAAAVILRHRVPA